MPIILLIFILTIRGSLYYHDKNITYGLAYETAVVGAVQKRQDEKVDEEELTFFFQEKAQEKLLFLEVESLTVNVSEEYIEIEASVGNQMWRAKVREVLLIELLEDVVRDKRRVT